MKQGHPDGNLIFKENQIMKTRRTPSTTITIVKLFTLILNAGVKPPCQTCSLKTKPSTHDHLRLEILEKHHKISFSAFLIFIKWALLL